MLVPLDRGLSASGSSSQPVTFNWLDSRNYNLKRVWPVSHALYLLTLLFSTAKLKTDYKYKSCKETAQKEDFMYHTIVTLKKGEGRTIKSGGAWVFDNEIDTITGRFKNGDLVTVHDFDGYPMGSGFINQNSKIRIRMMTRKADQEIDHAFLIMRVKNAWDYRKTTVDTSSCRIIFGEADFLPGLVIDKYEDILVVECLALGMEAFKEEIVMILRELLAKDGITIRGVYERSDANERTKEGLPKVKGFIGEEFDTTVEIVENGVHYLVDVANGQKTGFFLDQKYNRLAMQRICKGKKVLDCFTHMGTFALNAGIAGASDVTGLDISEYAVSQAEANARLNGLQDTVHFRCANVLDELPKLAAAGEKYDVVILDPPAFTKSREATKNAIKGYREINMKGKRRGIFCHLFLLSLYDAGAAGKDCKGSCQSYSQTTSSGRVPHSGSGPSDPVGRR